MKGDVATLSRWQRIRRNVRVLRWSLYACLGLSRFHAVVLDSKKRTSHVILHAKTAERMHDLAHGVLNCGGALHEAADVRRDVEAAAEVVTA